MLYYKVSFSNRKENEYLMAKNRCPVCMTKMKTHPDGHTLVCPECGYKLCDHSYTDRDLFSEEHYHSDYVTYSKPSQATAQIVGADRKSEGGTSTHPLNQRSSSPIGGSRASAYQQNTQRKGKQKRFGWELYFFIIMIIIYLLMRLQQ